MEETSAMICSKCSTRQEIGKSVNIVSGTSHTKILSEISGYNESHQSYKQTASEKTYTDFEDLSLWICQDCWQLLMKKRINEARKKIVTGAIPVIVFMLLFISTLISMFQESNPVSCFLVAGVVFVIFGILEVKKINTWNGLKKKLGLGMLESMTEYSTLDELVDIIYPLVYESRKADVEENKYNEVLFWDAKACHLWLKKVQEKPEEYKITIHKGVPYKGSFVSQDTRL